MKKRTFNPKITEASRESDYLDNSIKKESILPSVGSLTGAARMVARSAARVFIDEVTLPLLNAVRNK